MHQDMPNFCFLKVNLFHFDAKISAYIFILCVYFLIYKAHEKITLLKTAVFQYFKTTVFYNLRP